VNGIKQGKANATVVLNSLGKMESFVRKIKFPYSLSEDELDIAEEELQQLLQQDLSKDDAMREMELKYCVSVQDVLSDFNPIVTADNDKRTRRKKVSLRIIAEASQTKSVVISPGLHELLDEPTHVSFQAKDNVLVIGKDLPSSKGYKLHIDHGGFVIKSESLVDYLCDCFKLLDYRGTMNTNESKPFKTAFSDYRDVTLKMGKGLTTVVFMHIPSSR